MKKTIREVNNGVVQLTIADERWYWHEQYGFVPSVTWITSHYPKSPYLLRWFAEQGSWDDVELVKREAAERGSKVHQAIVDLIDGKEVKMNSQYINPTNDVPEELTVEEYEAVLSFVDWWNETKPEIVAREVTVFNEREGYAGTIDLIAFINGELWIVDFKTSQHVSEEYELQVSAYKHAYGGYKKEEMHGGKKLTKMVAVDKLGILQVGYRLNKRKWKMNEVEDRYELFLATKKIWQRRTEGVVPLKREYPESVKLGVENRNRKK